MDFVHLHLHTEYSLLDGCCRVEQLLDAVAAKGQKSVAITDHGVMYGAVQFYKAAKKRGLHPVIGCEVYVAPRTRFDKQRALDAEYSHLVLLCENETGYRNLIKMVSAGFVEGFYAKPRVDRELLEKYHEGIIALSACLAGEIPRALLRGDYEAARQTALWYRDTFGADNYYIELQDHGLPEQQRILPLLLKLAAQLNIPTVATNDVHYIEKEDSFMHKVLLCVQTGSKINEENPIEFKTEEFYLKTAEEMAERFGSVPESMKNTVKIAERCQVDFEFGNIKLPFFDTGGVDHAKYFRDRCFEGAYRIYGEALPPAVCERLDYELSVIERMGYVDYYLIVWDFIRYAKSQGIPVGPGRGSGAGSLAAYCIGITGIDPLRYDLLFERFLNPERVSMPDFDIDFCYVNRSRVIDYVTEKYGSDRVAQIVTFGTMAARAAIRDVGRAMDFPYALCDKVAKLIPQAMSMTIDRAMEGVKELRTLYDGDERVRELVDMARKVEGMPRHASTHAAGVVIADRPVSEYVPLSVNDESVVTQYTMTELEELGLLKMDFLGLRNLTVIADTEKEIRKTSPDFSVENIPIDDAETYQMLGKGLTEGVFQFESDGMKTVLRRFGPETLEDLIAILSLYRPGPMDSIPKYIHNRHHPEDVTYDTPLLKPILDVTYGCIVYQEQVMQICRALAGYSLGRADVVRRAMAKKKHAVMQKERSAFVYGEKDENGRVLCEGAIARGVPETTAQKIFDDMSAFSSYAFNKSHAAAYALVAYRTAYLKCHYPAAYFAALLTSVLDSAGKIAEYTTECKRMGLSVLPPSVNESEPSFTAVNGKIRFGLSAIKNLGHHLIDQLIAERKNGKYTSMYDFCVRNAGRDLNRRAVESLIKSGAMDGLADNRRQMLCNLERVLAAAESERRFAGNGQMNLFGAGFSGEPELEKMPEMDKPQRLAFEKESTGLYLSGHPTDAYRSFIERGHFTPIGDLAQHRLPDGKRVTVVGAVSEFKVRQLKNKSVMAASFVEDLSGTVAVTAFGDTFSRFRSLLTPGAVVLLSGKVSEREDRDAELLLERVDPLPENAAQTAQSEKKIAAGLYLRFESENDPVVSSVRQLLKQYPGNVPVTIVYKDTGKRLQTKAGSGCSPEKELLNRLVELLGEANMKWVETNAFA